MCMYLKCQDCGVTDDKADVVETICPFVKELFDEDEEATLCDECYYNRCMEI